MRSGAQSGLARQVVDRFLASLPKRFPAAPALAVVFEPAVMLVLGAHDSTASMAALGSSTR